MTRVKICGLRRREDADYCNRYGADYAGFVFWKGSRRFVSPAAAKDVSDNLLPRIVPVGVFVDEDVRVISSIADSGTIRMVQLHGDEDQEYIDLLKENVNIPIIRAYRPGCSRRFHADYSMFDGGAGDGKTFDWSSLKDVHGPFFLAGGLSAENVPDAIRTLRPFAVDVSTGVETDGYKDPEKIRLFIEAVRKADAELEE